jgi:hypothetical protein
MDFVNHSGVVFYQVFPQDPFSFTETLETVRGLSLKKQKSQGKAVELTVKSKEENSSDFCLDYVQEFGLRAALGILSNFYRHRLGETEFVHVL